MKATILILMTALLSSTIVSAQKPLTLQQCVDTALANNRSVKQQGLTRQTKEIAYQQARQNLLPNLNASANQNWNFGRSLTVDNTYRSTNSAQTSFGFSSSLVLFDGLRMKYNIEARRAEKNASDADLLKIKQDITTGVAAVFLQVLLNKELLQISKEQLNLSNTKIEQRKALIESGKMAEGELLELIAQKSKEEMSVLQATNALNLSLLDLAQYLELEEFDKLDVVAPENLSENDLQLLSAEMVYESALTHRPEIKGAEFRLKTSEYGVLNAKSEYYPSLNLQGQYGSGYYKLSGVPNASFGTQLKDNMSTVIGLNLQIPIFNKFEIKNKVRTAQIGVESSKLEVENARKELKKSIQQAYYNAIAAKGRWNASQKSEIASREAYRFANQKYESGRASSYELYQAKNNLSQVLLEQAQAKYEYFFRVKLLELMK